MQSRFLKAGVLLTAFIFTACQTEQELVETTAGMVSETFTESDHSLLRPFTIDEAFKRITVSGEKFTFPVALSELDDGGSMSGYRYENNILYFPDGGIADAMVDNGMIYYLNFSQETAPEDFSLMGLTLGAPYDIIYSTGIPDESSISDGDGWVRYDGVYGQYFKLDFSGGRLTSITMVQE